MACLWYCSWDSTSDESWLTCSICTTHTEAQVQLARMLPCYTHFQTPAGQTSPGNYPLFTASTLKNYKFWLLIKTEQWDHKALGRDADLVAVRRSKNTQCRRSDFFVCFHHLHPGGSEDQTAHSPILGQQYSTKTTAGQKPSVSVVGLFSIKQVDFLFSQPCVYPVGVCWVFTQLPMESKTVWPWQNMTASRRILAFFLNATRVL